MHTITVTLPLSLAINAYDHVRDLRPQGIDLLVLELPIEEIFFRFTKFREWDASEMSFGKAVSLLSEERPDIVAIPVFPSRVFRHWRKPPGSTCAACCSRNTASTSPPSTGARPACASPAGSRKSN